jgi:hypothetical protein
MTRSWRVRRSRSCPPERSRTPRRSRTDSAVGSDLTYETILIDKGNDRVVRLARYDLSQVVLEVVAFSVRLANAPGQTGGPGKYRVPALGIRVAEQAWSVAGIDDLEPPEGDTVTGTYTEALAALRRRQAERPTRRAGSRSSVCTSG